LKIPFTNLLLAEDNLILDQESQIGGVTALD
jgi:hypothetical protein